MCRTGNEYFVSLKNAREQLARAELLLKESINRRDELKRQLRGEKPGIGSDAQKVPQQFVNRALDSRIYDLQSRLDDLLLKYTDRHPDVAALVRTIKNLEQRRDQEKEEIRKSMLSPASAALDANPIYQQLKISLGEGEATVAGLKVRVQQYQLNVEKLVRSVDIIPKVEAEFQRLNRDYSIYKKNYDTLVQRRESAKISESAGQSSDSIKFRVVNPPFVDSKPASPNRPLLSTAVLLGGFIAGLAFAFFMSQVKPTYDSPRNITNDLEVPVFGSISRVWTGNMRFKRRMDVLVFGLAGLGLVGLYGAYMGYQIIIRGAA